MTQNEGSHNYVEKMPFSKAFHFFWDNIRPNQVIYIISLFSVVVMPILNVYQTDLTRSVIDSIELPDALDVILPILSLMLGLQIFKSIFNYIIRNIHHETSQSMLLKQRTKLYAILQTQDMQFYKNNQTGELMSRISGDIDMVRYFISFYMVRLIDSVVAFISAVTYLCFINIWLTLSLIIWIPVIFALNRFMAKTVRPFYKRMREKTADLNKVVQENIAGNRVVKAYAKENYEIEKFDAENNELTALQIKANRKYVFFSTPIDFIASFMAACALIIGGLLVINGDITIGQMSVSIGLSWALTTPLKTWGILINDWQRITTSVERILPIYYSEPKIISKENAYNPDKIEGNIIFDHVTLTLDDTKILDDVSFEIKHGQTVAIMGPTGSGKTFITNLILRLYDVTDGRVLLDGVDVRDYNLHKLRKFISVSTQDVFLFSETIESNICYGSPEIPMEKVEIAAKNAQAFSFILNTPDGFDTIIGERGVGLSGGQKQRLALARAFAVEAPVLILDDTTSALDMETESEIQHTLKTNYANMSQIIIAQRISSVNYADNIIILENGHITEQGKHADLLENNGYYKNIYDLQSGVINLEYADITDSEEEVQANGKK